MYMIVDVQNTNTNQPKPVYSIDSIFNIEYAICVHSYLKKLIFDEIIV